MIKKILSQLTPFVLIAVAIFITGVYYLVSNYGSAGLQFFGFSFLLILAILIFADYMLKKFLKLSLLKLWIVELLLVLAAVYIWIIQ